jgi:regulator of protease activity HflC (stomatin/prohibitin superfamily)
MIPTELWQTLGIVLVIVILIVGIRIVRPTQRAVIERLGKYARFADPGFHWIIPVIEHMMKVDTTENMVDIASHEIITEDNLNARVDMMIYFQVQRDEENVKRSLYEVSDFRNQIVSLAQTTARNVIGGMAFKDVNSQRSKLNTELATILRKETGKWGVEVVRVEMKEVIPPTDVQETMNMVIKAENSKRSAIDFATAKETEADGNRRAMIKEAEGKKQAAILEAEGQAQAFDLINKSFTGNAQLLKQLEVTQNALQDNAKIIVTDKGISPQLFLGELPVTFKSTPKS